MVKIRIITETVLEIDGIEGEETISNAHLWQKKVSDFLCLVAKNLVQGIEYKNQKITSIKYERD